MKVLNLGVFEEKSTTRKNVDNYSDFFRTTLPLDGESEVYSALISDLLITVGKEEFTIWDAVNDRSLSDYAVIIARGSGIDSHRGLLAVIAEYAHLHGITLVNDYRVTYDASKLLQTTKLHLQGALVPYTIAVSNQRLPYLTDTLSSWKYPAVLKNSYAARGSDNHLVNNGDDIKEITRSNPASEYVLQRKIQGGRDYRILLLGDEELVIERTAEQGSHLTNTSQGGIARLVQTMPRQVMAQAKNVATNFGLTWTGVDVMQDSVDKQYYFLEANLQPQLKSGTYTIEKQALLSAFFAKHSN